jgi:serine/threonine protein kinase
MAVVYKAWQLSLKRLVAVKMLLNRAGATDRNVARFAIEAEAVARLQHPHIVHSSLRARDSELCSRTWARIIGSIL